MTNPLSFDNVFAVNIRVGRIVAARFNPAAIKPAFHLEVDFGAVVLVHPDQDVPLGGRMF